MASSVSVKLTVKNLSRDEPGFFAEIEIKISNIKTDAANGKTAGICRRFRIAPTI